MYKAVAIALVLIGGNLLVQRSHSQEQGAKTVLFHVTSVQQKTGSPEVCRAGSCYSVRFTVDGYLDSRQDASVIEYALTCDELVAAKPKPHRTNICARLHAGNVYIAELGAESLSFTYSRLNKDFETDYNITSEKEQSKALEEMAIQSAQ